MHCYPFSLDPGRKSGCHGSGDNHAGVYRIGHYLSQDEEVYSYIILLYNNNNIIIA